MRRQNEFFHPNYYRSDQSYGMMPFRFQVFDDSRMLLVNETGEHLLLTNEDFRNFIDKKLPTIAPAYFDLKGKHFLFDSNSTVPVKLLAIKYRTKKEYLSGFVKLHIFVVSLRCEHSCHYCQVSRVSSSKALYDMSPETANKAVDLVFRSPADRLKIEFQGGEPLLNFETIRRIVEISEQKALATGKYVEFVITTNLALINDEILSYCRVHQIYISTSLDGPLFIHNQNRPRPEKNSYQLTVEGIERVRKALGSNSVSALMTATKLSLNFSKEIIDEYIDQGFHSIFLRSLSPYGFAEKSKNVTGYTIEEFLDFYVSSLDYIIELNKKGIFFVETFAQIILTRILTPFSTGYVDLQSPAGAGISVAVYNYDGDVYASDESRMLAEMNDTRFRLGNVHQNSWEEIFGGNVVRELVNASNVESIPVCSDCAFQSFCGSDPVFNYGTQGDLSGYMPSSDFHKKHFFIIKRLLELYHSDVETAQIFHRWVQPPIFDSEFCESKAE